MKNFIISYIWVILWMAIVLYLISAPGDTFNTIPSYPGIDKIVHMGMFFIFSTLLYNAMARQFFWNINVIIPIIVVSVVAAVFAGITELLQYYIFTYRSGDYWDLLADIVGIGMSGFTFLLFYRRKKI